MEIIKISSIPSTNSAFGNTKIFIFYNQIWAEEVLNPYHEGLTPTTKDSPLPRRTHPYHEGLTPTPSLNLPLPISLIVDAIFTKTLGCLNVIGETSIEYMIFSVSLINPALAVNKSKAGTESSLLCLCLPTM